MTNRIAIRLYFKLLDSMYNNVKCIYNCFQSMIIELNQELAKCIILQASELKKII